MLMIPPAGGDTFTAYSGFEYISTDGSSLEVGPGDIREAFSRGWAQTPTIVGGTSTEILAPPGAIPTVVE